MAIIDEIDRTLSNLGKNAMKKAKDVSESARLSGIIREEEEKQRAIFMRIGEYIYENEPDELNEQVKEWCDGISASRVRIIQIREQLRRLRGMARCPQCGATVAADSAFCSVCGKHLDINVLKEESEQKETTDIICSNCGRAIEGDSAFCTYCGTRINSGQSEVKDAENVQKNICPNCGTEIMTGRKFCIKCGMKLTE